MSYRFALQDRSPALDALRLEVREFLAREMPAISVAEQARSWHSFDRDFSRKIGAQGWIGMTWPKEYGGHNRSLLERYTVIEELLAAGAPIGAHWTGDRQSGPMLMRYGTEEQKRTLIPRMVAGEIFFCIGMSEPNAGSDLAGIKTRAERVENGWKVNGQKIWTTYAHKRDYMIMLARTSEEESRHAGMSQFLVDLKGPGITVRPIMNMAGEENFNEVFFEDAILPADALLGEQGDGWHQVTSELGYERSGPERFLTAYILLRELVRVLGDNPSDRAKIVIGRLAATLSTLRAMSFSLAAMLASGDDVTAEASVVKDMGSVFEQSIPYLARDLIEVEAVRGETGDNADLMSRYIDALSVVMLHSPSFSIYGGTREILRGITARTLGLR
ncbi:MULTISPECIES: acyl-CoA dehydrogenase family protein [unclassified Sphingobium]|uniref:acyl-CoA dehydrogenase family protein n=1 Tax=unclassified Sphingobium TaxID=2611147 RepID=UPI000D15A737|nr:MULTISPECIES: acyl-CoA dehydrogenase family protein [unclassified Sphingobium]MBG6120069.1 alkylation response protein AidB-like acyl-CoA dehydrogenase [Sphingobium sp. JAI105]PSO12878.1 acyl-CoA dehydrogenase [Sphingobium sp. AEW4]TWD05730.1 alkylation response protein AidB-like acyl-CoA dehydrogenase [Sphingobium sp. AEW010]TWD23283.1 alkylation response protein AidB-like acyl-CoA dehydrogenase [Sphingobium sp. AEW013]TWD25143.1 alkylation response protein AidB-like acyl-CoA dehydrogenase